MSTPEVITVGAGPLGYAAAAVDSDGIEAGMTPTSNEIKHRLRRQGKTLKDFARENGFQYRTVSDAVRGLRQGNYGEGREVRLKLGLPVKD